MTKENYNELKKHEQVFDLVYNHGYVPQASNDSFRAIAALHAKIFGIPMVDMTCEGCRSDMLRQMYNKLNDYERSIPPVSILEGAIVIPTEEEKKELEQITKVKRKRR